MISLSLSLSLQVMKNTLHPTWVKFEISSQTLCSSDPARKIQVRPTLVTRLHARIFKFCSTFYSLQVTCYDWDSDGSHDLIGHFTTTLGEITEAYQTQKKACTSSYLDSSLTVVDESFPPPPPPLCVCVCVSFPSPLPSSFPFSSSPFPSTAPVGMYKP